MAASELKGSRTTGTAPGGIRTARRLFSADSDSAGLSRGDDYPDDSSLASELRRKLVKIAADPNLIPGVFFVTADYMNYSEY